MPLAEFSDASIEDLTARLIPLNHVLTEYPALRVDAETEAAIALGKVFSCGNVQGQPRSGETSLAPGSFFRRSSYRTRQASRCG